MKKNISTFIITEGSWLKGEYMVDMDSKINILTLDVTSISFFSPMFYIADNFSFLDAADLNLISYMFMKKEACIENDADWYNDYDYTYQYSITPKHLNIFETNYLIHIYQDNYKHGKHIKNNFSLVQQNENFLDRFFNFNINNHYIVGHISYDIFIKSVYLKDYKIISGYRIQNLFINGLFVGACLGFSVDILIAEALKQIPEILIKKNTRIRLSLAQVVVQFIVSK